MGGNPSPKRTGPGPVIDNPLFTSAWMKCIWATEQAIVLKARHRLGSHPG